SLEDEYLQARAEDLTGVARQVVAALTGDASAASLSAPGIVVAADLAPADTASLDRKLALGVATAAGSPTSHSAILARPLGVPAAIENGAEGVGLLRTEFLFLERDSMPTEDEQYVAYKSVAAALAGRPLILRTLDVGADKPLPYLPLETEANPFLGVRGIRLALERPELLETQLRAVLRTAAEHPLKVMFPMVATLAEYRQAKAVLAGARAELERAG